MKKKIPHLSPEELSSSIAYGMTSVDNITKEELEDVQYYCELVIQQKNEIDALKSFEEQKSFALFCALYQVLEKEDPENVSSRIEQLTGKDISKFSEIYKRFRMEGNDERK